MATHKLKIWPPYFEAVASGAKPFEIRKDDRGFKAGDVLVLREWEESLTSGNRYTRREVRATVTYLLRGGRFGLAEEYVCMGIRLMPP